MELLIFQNIIIILLLSIVSLIICSFLRIPSIVGFLLTGILAGPSVLNLFSSQSQIQNMAEIGIILLLFTIGMEFSLKKLAEIKRAVFLGGFLQVALTTILTILVSHFFGLTFKEGLFFGFLVSLSSTAIVMKIFQERGEVDSPHGKNTLAILIFQDIIVVLMILFTPIIAGKSANAGLEMLFLGLKGIALIVGTIILARYVVPNVLYRLAMTHSKEIFLSSVILLCFAIALLTDSIGLSLGLGAFLAGLIISETEYSFEVRGNVHPFRDVFTSIFFISIGLLLDLRFVFDHLWIVLGIAFLMIFGKIIVGVISAYFLGLPIRTVLLIGFSVSQIGEFSFVLSKVGVEYGLVTNELNQIFFASAVLTMAIAPFIIFKSNRFADFILKIPGISKIKSKEIKVDEKKFELKDHIIIVGYGLNGKYLSDAAESAKIPYVALEMNAETVKRELKKNTPIIFGDAANEEVLSHVNIEHAKMLVIAITDPAATKRIIKAAKSRNPKIYIIARTLYVKDVTLLRKLGADDVIPQEFEASIEIFARVLSKYDVPKTNIDKFINEIRNTNYDVGNVSMKLSTISKSFGKTDMDMEIVSAKVKKDSALANQPLSKLDLRKKHGVTLLAIRRGSKLITNPSADVKIIADDILILVGEKSKLGALDFEK